MYESELCMSLPADLGTLASMLDESRELTVGRPEGWFNASGSPGSLNSANNTDAIEAEIERRMFELHVRVQHPYGRRLADRVYNANSRYMRPAPPPAPQQASSDSTTAGQSRQPISAAPTRSPPPQPVSGTPPPPANMTQTTSGASVSKQPSRWSLNGASITALVALLVAAAAGGSLCVYCSHCRRTPPAHGSAAAPPRGVHEPTEWRKNRLASECGEEDGDVEGREDGDDDIDVHAMLEQYSH